MGRQAEGPGCPPWGSRGRRSGWQAALLAAAILSPCFLLTQAQSQPQAIPVTVEPSQPLEGQDVTLTPGGNPTFVLCDWFRGGQDEANRIFTYVLSLSPPEQQNGPAFTGRETGGPGCSLHIRSLMLNDTGDYVVSKVVTGGRETERVPIAVSEFLAKPRVSAFPAPFLIESTGSVNLTCETTSNEVSLSWFYNGGPLVGSSRIQVSGDNRTVVIKDAIRNDTGEYQCEVANPVSNSTSDSLYVAVIYGPETPVIQPTEHSYNQHSEIRLSCYADAFPDAHYIWSLDGKELSRISELLIRDATPEDSGRYDCQARNVLSRHSSSATMEIEVAGKVSNVTIIGPSTAIENNTVQLECTSLGSLVSYHWFKGNQLVEPGDRVVLSDQNKTLTLVSSNRNDTARYVCQGVNGFSSAFSNPHLLEIFYGPDSPVIDPQESVYNEGSTLNLSCFADSNPPANYSWWYNDQLLEDQKDSQLLIQDLLVSNAGDYTCNATNNYTFGFSTTSLEVMIQERVSNVSITSRPDKAIENDVIVLDCRSAGSGVNYTWSKGDQILESGGHIILGNNSLKFSSVRRNDTGSYTCTGRNSFSSSSATYQLDVFYGPDEPVISPPGHDYGEGSLLSLSCHADSHPPAQYTWSFNGTELPKTDPQLLIPSLSLSQSGDYACNASNNETSRSKSTSWEIRVLENVSQVSIQGPSETTENSSLTLSCISKGSGVLYTWFKENKTLEDGGHISFSGLSRENLMLSPVGRFDRGFYTCHGNNSVSEDSSGPFHLEVFYGPDDPIITSLTEHDYVEGSSLKIACHAGSNPVANYTWFFNETEEVGNSSQLLIPGLSLDKAGDYTCYATNAETNKSRAAVWEVRVHEKLFPPVLWPTDLSVKEHANVTLNCNTSESSRVDVFWFKDGKPIPAKSLLSERNRTFHIPDVSRDDVGTYTCQAWNPANSAFSNPSKIALESPAPEPSGGLSPGAIVGIVIGCLVGAAIIVVVVYFALKSTTMGRMDQHSSNGNIPSAPGHIQGVTDTKPTAGEEDIQYTTLAFNSSSPPPPNPGPTVPAESGTIYSVIKKK